MNLYPHLFLATFLQLIQMQFHGSNILQQRVTVIFFRHPRPAENPVSQPITQREYQFNGPRTSSTLLSGGQLLHLGYLVFVVCPPKKANSTTDAGWIVIETMEKFGLFHFFYQNKERGIPKLAQHIFILHCKQVPNFFYYFQKNKNRGVWLDVKEKNCSVLTKQVHKQLANNSPAKKRNTTLEQTFGTSHPLLPQKTDKIIDYSHPYTSHK